MCVYSVMAVGQTTGKSPKFIYSGEFKNDKPDNYQFEDNPDPDLKTYMSYDLIAENIQGETGSKETTVKIVFLDPKSQHKEGLGFRAQIVGFISVDFIRRNSYPEKYNVKYAKKTNEKNGITYWYVIIDYNEDYDIVKVCNLDKPIKFNGSAYSATITFSKYGTKVKPAYELVFLCNRI